MSYLLRNPTLLSISVFLRGARSPPPRRRAGARGGGAGLAAEAGGVDAVAPQAVREDALGRLQEARRPRAVAAGDLERVEEEVLLVRRHRARERPPGERAGDLGRLQRRRQVM